MGGGADVKTLLKNAFVINVFTDEAEKKNVLLENDRIIGVGDYDDSDADKVRDLSGKFICPGLIDGHIHIESTMLIPYELANVVVPHGTTAIVADPHEIANVCGDEGIEYMLEASEGLPLDIYFTASSCVPATPFDETGATMDASDLEKYYINPRILGLAEMMNFPGVLFRDPGVMRKIADAKAAGKVVDGHAPLLSGKELDSYVAAGVQSDHECSNLEEAIEKLKRGQYIMIREGTAAKNLKSLIGLFDPKYNHRCLLVTDDCHPVDLLNRGHIDNIIRLAAGLGADPIVAIRMASLQAAQYFRIPDVGAVAPGYIANLTIVDELKNFHVTDVYSHGKAVFRNGELIPFEEPEVDMELERYVRDTFHVSPLKPEDFRISEENGLCRVIELIPGEIITKEIHEEIRFDQNSGIDISRDILKLAVVERHNGTGHIGIGFLKGAGMKEGAIASSVSHDSHNIIVIGTSDEEMASAANKIIEMGGGNVVVKDGEDIARMALPIAGLMSDFSAKDTAGFNARVRNAVYELGTSRNVEPFMNMAFVSLPVIPALKMSTLGLVDVMKFERVPLKVD
ncbi:MAG: adenine deaminase [Lachnospiraceae bacterium]|nr:adenine deaminase [Lachnospiraceae bacterium]